MENHVKGVAQVIGILAKVARNAWQNSRGKMTYKPGIDNPAHKDGRRMKDQGVRLGWITKALHAQIVAQLAGGQTLSDWVIAAIEAALGEEEGQDDNIK